IAGIVVEVNVGEAESEEAVDFLLIENTLGAALRALHEVGAVVGHRAPLRGSTRLRSVRPALFRVGFRRGVGLERQPPLGGERVLVDLLVFSERHWTTISLNSTALIPLRARAALARPRRHFSR